MLCQQHLQPAVTYARVSSLDCKLASLPCKVFQRLSKCRLCQRFGGRQFCLPRIYINRSGPQSGGNGSQVTLVIVEPQRGQRLPPERQVVPQLEHWEQVPVRTGFTGPQA